LGLKSSPPFAASEKRPTTPWKGWFAINFADKPNGPPPYPEQLKTRQLQQSLRILAWPTTFIGSNGPRITFAFTAAPKPRPTRAQSPCHAALHDPQLRELSK
jgi:hypothetical protein